MLLQNKDELSSKTWESLKDSEGLIWLKVFQLMWKYLEFNRNWELSKSLNKKVSWMDLFQKYFICCYAQMWERSTKKQL